MILKAAICFSVITFVMTLANAATARADHSPECGPPSTTIPGPPPEIISVGSRMLNPWLLCYIWHDIQGQDYQPRYFGDLQRVTFEGYPVECWNRVSDDRGTEGIQAEVFATGDEGRQTVRFVYRIQLDGDYINNCAQELQ
jgi:hypothetical protein